MKLNNPDEIAAAALELAKDRAATNDNVLNAINMSDEEFIQLLSDTHDKLRAEYLETRNHDIGEFIRPVSVKVLRREYIDILGGG